MFAFHRNDPRRTPADAATRVEDLARFIVGDGSPTDTGSVTWHLQLYDFAHLCFEVRENLAGQPLTEWQGRQALRALGTLAPYVLLNFRALAPYDRLEDGCMALEALTSSAVQCEDPFFLQFDMLPIPLAHVNAQWLQNAAHNEYLSWRRGKMQKSMCPESKLAGEAHERLRPIAPTRSLW